MKTSQMPSNRQIGTLLILGAVLVFIPYTILTVIFDYPTILREPPGVVLTRFHEGGPLLIAVWWAFAITGLPLLQAYVAIGQRLDHTLPFIRWATTLGVVSGLVQIIGLLRWTFVVPVLADTYVHATDPAIRAASVVAFQAIHQYGGVVLGEHLGQLLTIAWTVMMASAFVKLGLFPAWISRFGYVASGIYLLAQGDLFATVIPTFPVWELAGLLGSTLWLVWLLIVGTRFLRLRVSEDVPVPA
ncbi:DUF4386 domain-containing protein [Fibrisoma montanum]|uniref:DUF4386 domain-containing protein n=1 Tax=Fibrisoma montanum TaxID=2305895 RepID=A0A418MEW6_9BACT|nr:DUF4386 domain-containing protein [Fibrisoma montanum]RIV25316.1 DUF4386 domain-containing protein [Fibrisoma montanum]